MRATTSTTTVTHKNDESGERADRDTRRPQNQLSVQHHGLAKARKVRFPEHVSFL